MVEQQSSQPFVSVRVPIQWVTSVKHKAKNGNTYDMFDLHLPHDMWVEDLDVSGYQCRLFANRRNLQQYQDKQALITLSMRKDDEIMLRAIDNNKIIDTVTISDVYQFAHVLKEQTQAFQQSAHELPDSQQDTSAGVSSEVWDVERTPAPNATYQTSEQALQLLARVHADATLVDRLDVYAYELATQYVSGAYTPQRALEGVSELISDFTRNYVSAGDADTDTYDQDTQAQASHMILEAMCRPINQHIRQLIAHPRNDYDQHTIDVYCQRFGQRMIDYIADYQTLDNEQQARTTFSIGWTTIRQEIEQLLPYPRPILPSQAQEAAAVRGQREARSR